MLLPYRDTFPTIGVNTFVAANSTVIGDVIIGDESGIWFNAIVRGDVNFIRIGNRTNVQDACVLHVSGGKSSLTIGSNVTIGHSAIVHGCMVEDEVLIGMGSVILDNSLIKTGAIVAAGSVVREGFVVPERKLVAGVPARIVREVTDEEYERIMESSVHYAKLSREYKINSGLKQNLN